MTQSYAQFKKKKLESLIKLCKTKLNGLTTRSDDAKLAEFLSVALDEATHAMREAMRVEKIDHVDDSPRIVNGIDKWGDEYASHEALLTAQFNIALSEIDQKADDYLNH